MYGLKYIPDLGSKKENDRDTPYYIVKNLKLDFSPLDRDLLVKEFNKVKNDVKVILEIGVARFNNGANMSTVSTGVFLENKNDDTIYLGVDLADRSYVKGKNVHTLRTNSSNLEEIMNKIEELYGEKRIDFLFIDGWHSVNQVLDEWRFVEYLSKDGVIAFHDTNHHPGPREVLKAIDENDFEVKKYFEGKHDWGMAIVRRKT